ncbi:hypothetical protein L1987_00742 [Smallanthus sonchifolius]|uniref:Uncharacterized protein n=1 Tax=Smallanthus sonchifolius TaxID=185202 RepID=A0ACB9K3B6_9ASTR|nr:hypothetical protein L1987_00742 [Smallanthus sonchifolius]
MVKGKLYTVTCKELMPWSLAFDETCSSEEGSEDGSLPDRVSSGGAIEVGSSDSVIRNVGDQGIIETKAVKNDLVNTGGGDKGTTETEGDKKDSDGLVPPGFGGMSMNWNKVKNEKNYGLKIDLETNLKKVEVALEIGTSAQLIEEGTALRLALEERDHSDMRVNSISKAEIAYGRR